MTSLKISGSAFAGPRSRVAAGLVLLLLLALAGCNSATSAPDQSESPRVTIEAVAETAGKPPVFLVKAEPPPRTDLTVMVLIDSEDCTLAPRKESAVIAAGEAQATLPVPTTGGAVNEPGCVVTATIADGDGYRIGDAAKASATASRTPDASDPGSQPQPVVTIMANNTAGTPVSFTLTATPRPEAALTVNVNLLGSGSFLAASGPRTVTIPVSGTGTLTEPTADATDGSVTATVNPGSGYTVGSPHSATVRSAGNGGNGNGGGNGGGTSSGGSSGGNGNGNGNGTTPPPPAASCPEPSGPVVGFSGNFARNPTEGAELWFELTANPAPESELTVNLRWTYSGSYLSESPPLTVQFAADSSSVRVKAKTEDDSVDEANQPVTVRITCGSDYRIGSISSVGTTVYDNDVTPKVNVGERYPGTNAVEGTKAWFTLRATPKPASTLTVNVDWSVTVGLETGDRPETVTITDTTPVHVSVDTKGDTVNNGPYKRHVALYVRRGVGYNVGRFESAIVEVDDDET